MANYKILPQLGFSEAVRLASSRLSVFNGRSRRSEFWWWLLVVLVCNFILSAFVTDILVSGLVSIVVMFAALSVTVRRLHDTGRSGAWVYISYALGAAGQIVTGTSSVMNDYIEIAMSGNVDKLMAFFEDNAGSFFLIVLLGIAWLLSCLVVFFMVLIDGKPEPNKYGESPKYVLAES